MATKKKYAAIIIRSAYLIELDDLDVPALLEPVNAQGKGKVEKMEIVEFDDENYYSRLSEMLD